jgi:predicted neuraminidase
MAHAAGLQTASCALLFRPEPSPVPADSSIRDVLPKAMMMAAIIVATRRNPISTALGECDGQIDPSELHRHVHVGDAFC